MIAALSPSRAAKGMLSMLIASVLLAGCGSDSDPGTVCGGAVRDGVCYQLCDDALCFEGNSCVFTAERPEGYCTLPCQGNDECPFGFACYSGVQTASEEAGQYCIDLALPEGGAPGVACAANEECDQGHGLFCFEGGCAYPCSVVGGGCPEGTMCKGDPEAQADEPVGYCVAAPPDLGVPGRYGTDCPLGDDQCDTAAGFVCVGPEGSADAHCTKPDGCTTDEDCPAGYWCGATRVIVDGDIDFSQQPRTCLRRGFCDPCETDVDCSHTTNAICVPDAAGEKFCSMPCTPGTASCVIGASCEDVGDGRTACRPDVGVCHTDDPKGCDPCRIDPDCGPNALCADGQWGYKPAMKWCSTPCGPADADGKNTCPVAPNGLEMLCMDENMLALGGPFTADDPGYLYKHCYAPLTVDNTELFPGQDPPNDTCGNAKIEAGEECDDANDVATDGCDGCMVTAECTFTVGEPNGDGDPVISPVPDHVKLTGTDLEPSLPYMISTDICKSFKVEGAIESAGDVDVIAVLLQNRTDMWVDTFTSTVGSCTADLVTEARAWKDGAKTTDESYLDLSVPCEELSDLPENYVSNGTACPGAPTHLGCGTCDGPGVCGVCDNDNGIGNCTRMRVRTSTDFSGYPIYFDGRYKVLRIYADDPDATVGNYVLIGNRFVSQSLFGVSTPVALGCY